MTFHSYESVRDFGRETLDILMENEAQNNLPISFITSGPERDTTDWLMCAVKDGSDAVALIAACTPPYNIVLYEPGNRPSGDAVALLARELKALQFKAPGVLAEQDLARRFALEYAGAGNFSCRVSMVVMKLSSPPPESSAPGFLREITQEDLIFLPYWVREFARDCGLEHYEIAVHHERLEKRVGKQSLYVWQDGAPVAMTAFGRKLVTGAVINNVYTPPFLRGKGYARAVVGGVCRELFGRGMSFIALFADAKNPVSRGLYKSLGFEDICVYDELRLAETGSAE